MNERIKQILNEMDPYMSECTMLEFLARHRKMIYFNISLPVAIRVHNDRIPGEGYSSKGGCQQ